VNWINVTHGMSNGGLLWTRYWIFGLHEQQWISRLPEQLSDSQQGLYSMQSVG